MATKETTLQQRLDYAKQEIEKLEMYVRVALLEAPAVEPDWEELQWCTGRDRYVLIRPDGKRWWDVPYFAPYPATCFVQRPAALRAARGLPGCRIADLKTKTTFDWRWRDGP